MSAPAILSRLKQAGISVAVADGQLKLRGPKAALSEEVLSELRERKAELMAPAQIAEWRAAIEQVEPAAADWQRLKRASLGFLNTPDALAAIGNGWDAVSLFGLHKGSAPKERLDCWGLVLFLAWGIHGCTVETIGKQVCALRTRSGAVQSQPRARGNYGQAAPWWQHRSVREVPHRL